MKYRDELLNDYNNSIRKTLTVEQWMDIIESGDLSHCMVMELVRERDELRTHKACEQIKQLEEALDTRQAVYDKLLDDYTQLLTKSKEPNIRVNMALNELRKLAGMLRAQQYDPQLDHAREYLSGIEHAIATVEDYLGDVLK